MRKIKIDKRGEVLQQYLFEVIFSAVLIILFLVATTQKSDSRGLKQQILEKQTVLLIDSAKPGMTIKIDKLYYDTIINQIKIQNGKLYIDVDGLISINGYSYFSKYNINVIENENEFLIEVRE